MYDCRYYEQCAGRFVTFVRKQCLQKQILSVCYCQTRMIGLWLTPYGQISSF